MANNRLRISEQLELSSVIGSIIKTGTGNKPEYLGPGSNGQILTIVSGVPAWAAAPAGGTFTISDGTNTQTITAGDTVTFESGNGITAVVGATDKVTVSAKLSTDANNAVVFGGDGGLYVPEAQLVTGATWDDATNTLTITFADGSTVDIPIVDAIGTFLSDWAVQGDNGSYTVDNHSTLSIIGTPGQIVTDVTAGQVQISLGFTDFKQTFLNLSSGSTVTLSSTPSAGTILTVMRNGLEQLEGVGNDFTISGAVVTFATGFGASPGGQGSENVIVYYRVAA
jgi:hypothetical protein